jgi:8-oxo-dGTP pyrophosphatase MutT (NUDIX family)
LLEQSSSTALAASFFSSETIVPVFYSRERLPLFGGHREGNETYLQCLVREINEEIGYFVPAERFEHLANYEGADPETTGGAVRIEFFVARDIIVEGLVVTEGSLVIIKADELVAIEPKLTPSSRFAMKAFFDNQSGR